jgi:hypothetical protein
MRAILIDSAHRVISEIALRARDDLFEQLNAMTELIGGRVGAVKWSNPFADMLWVDVDAQLPHAISATAFLLDGLHAFVFGNGIVLGALDANRDATPARCPLDQLSAAWAIILKK